MGGWVEEKKILSMSLLLHLGAFEGVVIEEAVMGGWVGGWVGWVEEEDAVRVSYCGFGMDGWVGGTSYL